MAHSTSRASIDYLDRFIETHLDDLIAGAPEFGHAADSPLFQAQIKWHRVMVGFRTWLQEPESGSQVEAMADSALSVALRLRSLREQ